MSVTLVAYHAELNHHRHYQICVGVDLFRLWNVSICYGRIGHGGRVERFSGRDANELRAVIRDRLRRRLSAPQRIGCAYQLRAMDVAKGFDAEFWLPSDVMRKLSPAVQACP